MKAFKKIMALLLVFVLIAACVPLGTITAFAAENEEINISAVEAETETEPGDTAEPPETQNESAPPTDESAGGEPEEDSLTEDSNPFSELSNEFEPEVLESASFNSITTYGGSSGSEIGDGGGGGNAAGSGSSNMVAAGVTMQIVYYRYDQCYNRYNSHGSVINTLQTGKALPWNSTGKDNGSTATTVFDTFTISPHTFLVKAQWN